MQLSPWTQLWDDICNISQQCLAQLPFVHDADRGLLSKEMKVLLKSDGLAALLTLTSFQNNVTGS